MKRRIRRPAVIAALALIAAGYGGWRLYAWYNSPERAMELFVAANNRGDMGALLELLNPDEIKHFNLTKQRAAMMLRDAAGTPYIPKMVLTTLVPPEPTEPWAAAREVELLDNNGHALGGSWVIVARTDDGWKAGFTSTLVATTSRKGSRIHKYTYPQLAQADHFPSEMWDPASGSYGRVHPPINPPTPVPP